MRTSTLRWIIISFITLVVLLVCAQLFWLNKIFQYEVKVFRTNVMKALKLTNKELELNADKNVLIQTLTEQPDPNSFLFRIDSFPDQDVLRTSLYASLDNYGILSDCKVALYDNVSNRFLYEMRLSTMISGNPHYTPYKLSVYERKFPYIILHFPNRIKFILQSISWWIVSSTVILLFLIALCISIVYLYRQKSLNAVQNDFIRNVTHEFQTPLTTLTVGLDALTKPGILSQPEKLERYVKMMQGQTAYLNHHIRNLVTVIKTERGKVEMHKEMISPEQIISQVVAQMEVMIEERKAKVDTVFGASDVKIMADPSGLYMVLLNLLSNALKYASSPEIRIETGIRKHKYIITVSDNGIGIEKKYIRYLFRKFYRVPTGDRHDVKGLGLGLYFSNKIIHEHKGSIFVQSTPGKGTLFTIEFPMH